MINPWALSGCGASPAPRHGHAAGHGHDVRGSARHARGAARHAPRHLPGGAAGDGPAAGGYDGPAGGAGQAPGWPSLHGGAGATGAAEKGRRSAGAREAAADGQDPRRPPRTRDGRQTAHDVRHVSRQPHERHGSPRAPPPWGEHDVQPETEARPFPRRGWQKGVPDFLEFGNCV